MDAAVVEEISKCILRKVSKDPFHINIETESTRLVGGELDVESTTPPAQVSNAINETIVEDETAAVEPEAVPGSFHHLIPLVKTQIKAIISAAPMDDESTDLRECGLDSITATELANTLSDLLNVEILPSHFIDNFTVKSIIQLVMRQCGGEVHGGCGSDESSSGSAM